MPQDAGKTQGDKPVDDRQLQAQIKHLYAQAAKEQAEGRKLDAEAQEVDDRRRRKWYQTRYFAQASVGGIVAAALLVSWFTAYFFPFSAASVKEQEALVASQKAVNERIKLENTKDRQQIEVERDDLKTIIGDLQEDYGNLTQKYLMLSRQVGEADDQRDMFAARAQQAARKVEELQGKIEQVSRSESPEVSAQEPSLQEIQEAYKRIAAAPVRKIPVVVHVVWSNDRENISEEQILSQIDSLNRDYRATNADLAELPEPFKKDIGDARIEFVLATTDPNGKSTNGITRTKTTTRAFKVRDDSVRYARNGGVDAWDASKYLNIWVCTLAEGIWEYTQFPGGPRETDGMVIQNTAFGTTGTATSAFDRGRSATHGIGHYLNLLHIWGDVTGCAGNDFVADTPNALQPNSGNPVFPHISCNNGPHGDMFMNYMDNVDDGAMMMFTKGQVVRMHATLAGPRKDLRGAEKVSG